MNLRDWLPSEFFSGGVDPKVSKHLNAEVVKSYGLDGEWRPHPFREKNIVKWCVLANGVAVGWNENMDRGSSFPIIEMKGR